MSSPRTPKRNIISEVLDNLKPFSTPKRVLFQDSLQISSLRDEKKEGVSMDSYQVDLGNTVSNEPVEYNFDEISKKMVPRTGSVEESTLSELVVETEIASTDLITFEYVNFQTCFEGGEENTLAGSSIKTSELISSVQNELDLNEEEGISKENEPQSQPSEISREISGFNRCVEFFEASLFEECELSETGYTSCVENGSLKQYLMSPVRRSVRIREKVESEKRESTVRRMYSSPAIKTCISTRTRGDTDSDLESNKHISTLKRSRRRLIFTDLSGGSEGDDDDGDDKDSIKSARVRRSSRLTTPTSYRC